jgi:hypothetical protein
VKAKICLHKKNVSEEIVFETCNQYTLQGDVFSKAILDNATVPYPLSDAVSTMKVIEAIFESGKCNSWVEVN